MAIDKETGKRIKTVKNRLDLEREKIAKAMPKFDTNYEEELKKQLFADNTEQVVEDIFQQDDEQSGHHERPGEE